MVNLLYESLFPRFAAPGAASHRCGSQPEPSGRAVCSLGGDHQTLPQTATRERPCRAQSDPRPSQRQRSSARGPFARPIRGPSRPASRRAVSPLQRSTRHRGQSSQYHTRKTGPWLDAKKKTIRASGQKETERAAWRKQTAHLASDDLVFVDETGSHIAMTPCMPTPHEGSELTARCPAIMEPS